jgi:hypothetical protein
VIPVRLSTAIWAKRRKRGGYYILQGVKKALYVILAIAAIAAWRDWSQRAIVQPPGVLVPQYPHQEEVAFRQVIERDGYRLTPRAGFAIRARCRQPTTGAVKRTFSRGPRVARREPARPCWTGLKSRVRALPPRHGD